MNEFRFICALLILDERVLKILSVTERNRYDARLTRETSTPQAPQAQNTWCMGQLVHTENCMGKSPLGNYLI